MRKQVVIVSLSVLLGVWLLIWREWPKKHTLPTVPDHTCRNFGTVTGELVPTVKPVWSKKQHDYFCPNPYLVSGGWEIETGKPYGMAPVCFMPRECEASQ